MNERETLLSILQETMHPMDYANYVIQCIYLGFEFEGLEEFYAG